MCEGLIHSAEGLKRTEDSLNERGGLFLPGSLVLMLGLLALEEKQLLFLVLHSLVTETPMTLSALLGSRLLAVDIDVLVSVITLASPGNKSLCA